MNKNHRTAGGLLVKTKFRENKPSWLSSRNLFTKRNEPRPMAAIPAHSLILYFTTIIFRLWVGFPLEPVISNTQV